MERDSARAGDDKKAKQAEREARRKLQKRQSAQFNKTRKQLNLVFNNFNKNALFDDPARALRLPEDYKYPDGKPKEAVEPETLFGDQITGVERGKRRETFGDWVTSPENPYFTKVIANRIWARTFGHGLLDPVDDWKENSKPAHPEVLAFLEETMKEVNYDLRQFSRVLFQTQLFQRECDPTEPEPGAPHLVRGPALERMTAEQLYDSMLVLTKGEIDDAPFPENANRWESYIVSVEKLITAESRSLLVLGENANRAETEYLALQEQARSMRSRMEDTKGDAERKKLNEKIRATQRKANEIRKHTDPLAMMSGGMNMMDMNMEMKPSMAEKNPGRNNDRQFPPRLRATLPFQSRDACQGVRRFGSDHSILR